MGIVNTPIPGRRFKLRYNPHPGLCLVKTFARRVNVHNGDCYDVDTALMWILTALHLPLVTVGTRQINNRSEGANPTKCRSSPSRLIRSLVYSRSGHSLGGPCTISATPLRIISLGRCGVWSQLVVKASRRSSGSLLQRPTANSPNDGRMYVCSMYVCMHACMYVCMCVRMYVCIAYIDACMLYGWMDVGLCMCTCSLCMYTWRSM